MVLFCFDGLRVSVATIQKKSDMRNICSFVNKHKRHVLVCADIHMCLFWGCLHHILSFLSFFMFFLLTVELIYVEEFYLENKIMKNNY